MGTSLRNFRPLVPGNFWYNRGCKRPFVNWAITLQLGKGFSQSLWACFGIYTLAFRCKNVSLEIGISAHWLLDNFTFQYYRSHIASLYNSLYLLLSVSIRVLTFRLLYACLLSCRSRAHPPAGPSISNTSLRSFSCWATATLAAWIISLLAIPLGIT